MSVVLAAHEQDKLRNLLNAFNAAPDAVRVAALQTLNRNQRRAQRGQTKDN